MSKAWFALAVIALVLLAVMGRYEIVPTSRDEGKVVLKLDRWTGQTMILGYNPTMPDGSWLYYWSRPVRADPPK